PTLEALAYLQLQYILALPNIPTNIHDGILGEGVRDRGLWAPFNWPYYDIPDRINLVEITVAQRTIGQGITWWKNSPIHNEAATNPYYREVGVAALPYRYGTVFVAVLGGRPGVLPALVHPDGETLYLTQEHFWTQSPTSIGFIRAVRLLDEDQAPLGSWQPWRATLPLPEEFSGEILYVEYTDGSRTVTTPVNLATDIIRLPSQAAPDARLESVVAARPTPPESALVTLLAAEEHQLALKVDVAEPVYLADFHMFALVQDTIPVDRRFSEVFPDQRYALPGMCFILRVEGTTPALPESCTGAIALFPVSAEGAFWYDSAQGRRASLFVLSARGQLLGDCRDAAVDCVFSVGASTRENATIREVSRTIELIYSPGSFALINRGNQPLNLFGLAFVSGNARLPIGIWNVATGSAPLGFFPADDCLQTWGFTDPRQPKPASCNVRHAWTTVGQSQKIWLEGTFDVIYNNQTVTTCEVSAGQCVFELPG
ncbi:MAG: hypothetical protein JXN59_09840, partial [Anaerolineae bacterium]|nr:hypothetical protein [Anaerolineae bacterium]